MTGRSEDGVWPADDGGGGFLEADEDERPPTPLDNQRLSEGSEHGRALTGRGMTFGARIWQAHRQQPRADQTEGRGPRRGVTCQGGRQGDEVRPRAPYPSIHPSIRRPSAQGPQPSISSRCTTGQGEAGAERGRAALTSRRSRHERPRMARRTEAPRGSPFIAWMASHKRHPRSFRTQGAQTTTTSDPRGDGICNDRPPSPDEVMPAHGRRARRDTQAMPYHARR